MKKLNWIKCKDDRWCKLNNVNLDHSHFDNRECVYIIWNGGGSRASVLRIGYGNLREVIKLFRNDPVIQNYKDWGIYITWADVQEMDQDGVLSHLYDKWAPKIRDDNYIPKAAGIQINSPW